MHATGRLAPASPLERRPFPMASSLSSPPTAPERLSPADSPVRPRQQRNFDILACTPDVVCRFGPHSVAPLGSGGQSAQPEVFVTLPRTLAAGSFALGCGSGVAGGGLMAQRGFACLAGMRATSGIRSLASIAGAAASATILGGLVLMLGSLVAAALALRWVQASGRLGLRDDGEEIPLGLVSQNDARLALNYLRVEDIAMAGVMAPALALGMAAGGTGVALLCGMLACFDAAYALWALSAVRGVRLEPCLPAQAPLMAQAPASG